jgi:hypothetical protein
LVEEFEIPHAFEYLEVAEYRCEGGVHQRKSGAREVGTRGQGGLRLLKPARQGAAPAFPCRPVRRVVEAGDVIEGAGCKGAPAAMAGFLEGVQGMEGAACGLVQVLGDVRTN